MTYYIHYTPCPFLLTWENTTKVPITILLPIRPLTVLDQNTVLCATL